MNKDELELIALVKKIVESKPKEQEKYQVSDISDGTKYTIDINQYDWNDNFSLKVEAVSNYYYSR